MKTETSRGPEGPSRMWGRQFVEDGEERAVLVLPLPSLPDKPIERASNAESEIVRLVLEGLSNQAIAERRGTSTRTVANQLQSLYRKLGVTSRIELIRKLSLGEGRRATSD